MKKQNIKKIISKNEDVYEDDGCAVCKLMKKCEIEAREPTMKELGEAIKLATS